MLNLNIALYEVTLRLSLDRQTPRDVQTLLTRLDTFEGGTIKLEDHW